MDLQLYNTLPEWAIELSTGSYAPPIIVERIILSDPTGGDEIQTKERGTKRDFSGLLGVDNSFNQSEPNSFRFTLLK